MDGVGTFPVAYHIIPRCLRSPAIPFSDGLAAQDHKFRKIKQAPGPCQGNTLIVDGDDAPIRVP
jgi:hypothetical protein